MLNVNTQQQTRKPKSQKDEFMHYLSSFGKQSKEKQTKKEQIKQSNKNEAADG